MDLSQQAQNVINQLCWKQYNDIKNYLTKENASLKKSGGRKKSTNARYNKRLSIKAPLL